MNFQKFAFDASSWMKDVCHELFKSSIITPYDDFDFLFDYDPNSYLACGFSVISYPLSMGDSVIMNRICENFGCFYVIYPCENNFLSIHFYLETHG